MHSDLADEIIVFQKSSRDDFYALLGCDPSASPEQIQSEYKARARQLHPDKAANQNVTSDPIGGNLADQPPVEKTWDELTDAFQALKRARDVLMDPEKRKLYDDWLAGGIAMPFADWLAKRNVVRMAMHWAAPQGPKQMSITDAGVKGASTMTHLVGSRRTSVDAHQQLNSLNWGQSADLRPSIPDYDHGRGAYTGGVTGGLRSSGTGGFGAPGSGTGGLKVPVMDDQQPVFDAKSDMPARLWQRRRSSLLEKFRKYEI